MRRFRVQVIITKEYEVEVDESIINEEFREDFEKHLYDLDGDDTQEAVAQALAEQSARIGVNRFIEGFGRCAESKEAADLWNSRDFNKNNKCTEGLYIDEVDDDIKSYVDEVEDFDC